MTEQEHDQDAFEAGLHASYLADLATLPPVTEEQRRRVFALCRYECPDCGRDLEEWTDVDEAGAHVSYRCLGGLHRFGSVHDPVGGYAPVDDEIGVVRIDHDQELRG